MSLFCCYICSYYKVVGHKGLLGGLEEWRKKNEEIIYIQKNKLPWRLQMVIGSRGSKYAHMIKAFSGSGGLPKITY